MSKVIIEIKDENGDVRQTLSGETAIVITHGGIEDEKNVEGKAAFGFDGSVGIVGRKVPVEDAGIIYGHLFARTIKALFPNELESAFVLSEIADICEKDSDTTLEGMTPEKFAEAAADSLTQVFKDVFNK